MDILCLRGFRSYFSLSIDDRGSIRDAHRLKSVSSGGLEMQRCWSGERQVSLWHLAHWGALWGLLPGTPWKPGEGCLRGAWGSPPWPRNMKSDVGFLLLRSDVPVPLPVTRKASGSRGEPYLFLSGPFAVSGVCGCWARRAVALHG